jgi:hypothetical protein
LKTFNGCSINQNLQQQNGCNHTAFAKAQQRYQHCNISSSVVAYQKAPHKRLSLVGGHKFKLSKEGLGVGVNQTTEELPLQLSGLGGVNTEDGQQPGLGFDVQGHIGPNLYC